LEEISSPWLVAQVKGISSFTFEHMGAHLRKGTEAGESLVVGGRLDESR